MFAQTPPFAPLAVLAFLATAALLCVSILTLVLGFWRKSRVIQLGSVFVGLLLVTVYGGTLLAISRFSREVVLTAGGWKYFCEIDCHVGYTVQNAVKAANVGGELQQVTGNGNFLIVAVKSWFDPGTISPHRGNGPLTPNGRHIALVAEDGKLLAPSAQQEKMLELLRLHSTPLHTALHPGDSHISYFVFELPASVVNPKVLLTTTDGATSMLWGHENSYFHKKILFDLSSLPPQGAL
jgi:hypothetical protein